MPTYQYRCTECDNELEVVQKFSDPSLTVCPECEGALRKVFNAVGVVFKGSGFYRTDSRSAESKSGGSAKTTADSGSTSDSSAKSDSAKSDGGTKSDGASKSDGGGSGNGSSEKKTPATSGSSSTGSKAANN